MKRMSFLMLMAGIMILSSCNKEDMKTKTFTLTIENVSGGNDFFNGGTTGGIAPGSTFSFSFDAGKGHYLSLATMLAQSNDLFYGFSDMGLELYNSAGNPVTGDVTSKVYLWDAGTEVNEEPGMGPNQAPRQAAANSGMDENGMVKLISDVNDGFMYPSVSDIIRVSLTHDGGTMFTVTILNKSDMLSLTGPLAPGVWAVHSAGVQLFTENSAASSDLEMLSEDGNNMSFGEYIESNTGLVSPFAPGVYAVYAGNNPIFMYGMTAGDALEALAEDGNPDEFDFMGNDMISSWGVFNTAVLKSEASPIFPGEKYEVEFMASEGDYLSFATMLVQSNDLFAAPSGIDLFMGGSPMSGDITSYLKLWDAKTELNEYPGAGMNQAPRQSGPDTGTDETGDVEEVMDAYAYPAVGELLKITISYR